MTVHTVNHFATAAPIPARAPTRNHDVLPASYDYLTADDLISAMATYAAGHTDLLAQAYAMTLRAHRFDQKLKSLPRPRGPFSALRNLALWLAYGYERAALRAQAHQTYCMAVAQRKSQTDPALYDPDQFLPDPATLDQAHLNAFRRINLAHGHAALYQTRRAA